MAGKSRKNGPALQRILCIGLLAWGLMPSMAVGQDHPAPLLVMISVDGMRPDYVTQAAAHGAKVPNLTRFMKEGAYAEGVIGRGAYGDLSEPHDTGDGSVAGETRDLGEHDI